MTGQAKRLGLHRVKARAARLARLASCAHQHIRRLASSSIGSTAYEDIDIGPMRARHPHFVLNIALRHRVCSVHLRRPGHFYLAADTKCCRSNFGVTPTPTLSYESACYCHLGLLSVGSRA